VIAQVITTSGTAPDPNAPLDETSQKAMDETRGADGCEGIYVLAPREGGDSIAVVLWRDEAAMNAMVDREKQHSEDIEQAVPGMKIGAPKVYDVTFA
jgi:heme-degrading monooxygenase HmoA